jgi:hypothetical protein
LGFVSEEGTIDIMHSSIPFFHDRVTMMKSFKKFPLANMSGHASRLFNSCRKGPHDRQCVADDGMPNLLDLKVQEEELSATIPNVNSSKRKVKAIINTTRILKNKYEGDLPKTRKELAVLPGVGLNAALFL